MKNPWQKYKVLYLLFVFFRFSSFCTYINALNIISGHGSNNFFIFWEKKRQQLTFKLRLLRSFAIDRNSVLGQRCEISLYGLQCQFKIKSVFYQWSSETFDSLFHAIAPIWSMWMCECVCVYVDDYFCNRHAYTERSTW